MHLIVMMDGHHFEEPGMTHVVLHATESDFPFAATHWGGREAFVKPVCCVVHVLVIVA